MDNEVCLTYTKSLRSRVKGNFQARFWRAAAIVRESLTLIKWHNICIKCFLIKNMQKKTNISQGDKFTTSPAQQELLESSLLSSGFSCILQMPTGSGKTWLAEQAIATVLDRGRRAVYLTPLRALADELNARWQKRFTPQPVGVFTGDYSNSSYPVPYRDARLLVMTPEKLDACTRSWRTHWNWIPEVDLVVVDELHLLGEPRRGARLEAGLIHCDERKTRSARS